MIAHVAQTGEDRGRVVLHLKSGRPNAIALEAAVRVAQAFGSDLESIFVEDEQLFDCAAYGFVREVSFSGTRSRAMSLDGMMRDLHLACAETGPWNVVALGEPFTGGTGATLRQVLTEVAGSTGLIAVGPKAQRVTGAIVVALEDIAQLPDMLRAAERLAALDGAEIVLLLVATDEERLLQMDGEARLVVEAREGVRIQWAAVARGEAAVIAETLRRLKGGMIICQFGGLVVPDQGDLRPLASVLECPLFLVR